MLRDSGRGDEAKRAVPAVPHPTSRRGCWRLPLYSTPVSYGGDIRAARPNTGNDGVISTGRIPACGVGSTNLGLAAAHAGSTGSSTKHGLAGVAGPLHAALLCRSLRPPAPAMGPPPPPPPPQHPPLPRRPGLALVPAVAVFSTTLSGRVCISYADQSYGFKNHSTKNENRVFPIFAQKQDGEYSTAQLSAQTRISGSRSFVGKLLEKALVVFVKSQLDDCEDLRVAVGGSNWDLLGGNVRRIEVAATKAVYKGVVISEVGLAACNVRAKLGRKRLFQHPFRVNANIRIREQDFNSSLASPLMSSSFRDILPRDSQPLRVQYDNGNLRFSSSDKQSGRYSQVEYPIILRVGVENGGEVISVKSFKSDSLKKTFKVGPEVKITDFQVGSSWLSLTGEFLLMP